MNSEFHDRLRVIDELCDRYESAWRENRHPQIIEFLVGVDQVLRVPLLCELILLDRELRQEQRQETPAPNESHDHGRNLQRKPPDDEWTEISATTGVPSPGVGDGWSWLTAMLDNMVGLETPREELQGMSGGLPPSRGDAPLADFLDEEDASVNDSPASTVLDPLGAHGLEHGRHEAQDERDSDDDGDGQSNLDEIRAKPRDRIRLPRPGDVLGDYEIIEVIDQGGMGSVYRARQISLNRPVAVKTIRSGARATDREILLFQSEAEAIASLDHPSIVPILGVGEHEGVRYYSMKLIDGLDLFKQKAHYQGRFREIARLVAQIAGAIHHAHQRGVLHRDLKPSNILVDADGEPHVIDWGLAKRLHNEPASLRGASIAIAGTPNYMAPEQIREEPGPITTVTDVYGLGTILYSLLTQQSPFPRTATIEEAREQAKSPPRPPRTIDARIDPDLELICLKCLEKAPADRYASARELADDLNYWLDGRPIKARPAPWAERAGKWMGGRPLIVGLVAILHLMALVGLGGVLWEFRLAVTARREAEKNEDLARRQAYAAKLSLASRDGSDANLQRMDRQLRETADAPGKPDLREFEWHDLEPTPSALAYSLDGSSLITSGHADRTLKVWNAASGRPVNSLAGLPQTIRAIAVHPDGKTIATAENDGATRIRDVVTGQVIHSLEDREIPSLRAVAYSPDGKLVAIGSLCGSVRLWNPATGSLDVMSAGDEAQGILDLDFSPDGKQVVAIRGDHALQIWDVAARRSLRVLRGHQGPIQHAAYHPDGKTIVSCGADNTLRTWDAATGDSVHTLSLKQPAVHFAFSPDGKRIATVGMDQAVTIRDTASREVIQVFRGHEETTNRVAFSPDGKTIAASTGPAVQIWTTQLAQP